MCKNHVGWSYCALGNIHEQKLIDQLYQILEAFAASSSYQVEDESTVDYENNPTFDGSENEEGREDDPLKTTFSLEYMKNMVNFYDAIDRKTKAYMEMCLSPIQTDPPQTMPGPLS